MARLLAFISIIAAVTIQVASGDEVRHTTFAGTVRRRGRRSELGGAFQSQAE